MSIVQQLTADMGTAMKAGEADRVGTLRLLRAAMTNERIKAGHELSDDESLRVLQREAKQRRDSIEQYTQGNRPDLAAKELSELEVIDGYLPQQLSEDELRRVVDQTVTKLGQSAQIGAVIGAVMAQVGAQSDGGTVARLVRERLG